MPGDAERKTGVYTSVHEDSNTASTKPLSSSIEFEQRPKDEGIDIKNL
ncbi:hypothetical protein [Fluoribacter gormanii]|uniref:BirA family transcriptional regulator, biotin operon repressor / biotin-[acetyl-CoA-carboxylase] ligase n=1 Tax=Fluoribacter gormanii TaxID=464 RepID=A0A377GHB8_9GAMM|nr:BirA family transcriptional regulator, biotin operon repressor / biotin-[acetyl-CoA-carboxylase] ligase [Fluoribacter gormanii]STO24148.1 Uncharacterised protein [Fluoribacter gormanii]